MKIKIICIVYILLFCLIINYLEYSIKEKKNISEINYGSMYKNLWKCPLHVNKNINRKFYSQCKEDEIYFDLFFSKPEIKTNGLFVEIGALDGNYSNTLFYEKELGWRGILIEGLPSNCKKLLQRGRDRSEIFCTAVFPYFPMPVEFFDVWGMGGLKENNPFWKKENKITKPVINVTCTNIKDIFSSTGITHIDFFSLDVEGAEYMVLDTFNFSVRVKYWVIEFNSKNKAIDDYVINILYKNGYKKCNIPKMHIRNECFYDPLYDYKIRKMVEKEKTYFNNYGSPCFED